MAHADSCPREERERLEARVLRSVAAKTADRRVAGRRFPCTPDDFRTDFERDYTRIIHSRAFRRLRHKTQVFISPRNDHLCTRLEHSLHVASVANTIARALLLNTDLVSAIAAGHDVGHAPFGHKGERCLDELARKAGLPGFSHELQSLRVVDLLDSPYDEHRGLNLTFAVRDGIACHYGEGFEQTLEPDRQKQPECLESIRRGEDRPATLEGCVVRWADKVGYIGRDLEDAYAEKLVAEGELPKVVRRTLGTRNKSIIANLVRDIVTNSRDHDRISVGASVHEALNALYEFSRERIYRSETVTQRFRQIDKAMRFMFDELTSLLAAAGNRQDGDLFPDQARPWCLQVLSEFLVRDVRTWREERPEQLALDFVAGMTDSFFVSAFEELFFPRSTV
ncbi:MAG TPA: dNTP triphosphohydrolase [Planctomycetota bacterium]|nr:dNTP triphosphohydrolase [Planctomycetota bacterium]HRR78986.1 dNTP triphosphohydrolase [Planctomycetota bacterium]HRT93434.1 dNTP triphosphohydrolase [Planctomycetota bacterium]